MFKRMFNRKHNQPERQSNSIEKIAELSNIPYNRLRHLYDIEMKDNGNNERLCYGILYRYALYH